MTFKGLFVGIDRYASTRIQRLSCARRDAVALHALFSDTLGGRARLLTDEEATRSAIEDEFNQLAFCDPEDVVVIAFSGHGTQTHQLVTYDTDVHDLDNTSIPLDMLTEWFSRIPSCRLISFLDCCFSGEMGAKVLQMETVARDLRSTDSILQQLSGEGRLILTASKATEPAYENTQLRHGLLTYYLLQALQGAEEVRRSGKIAIYQLLEYVTQRVIDGAAQLGKPQHPTLRGRLDGELTWPVFKPGPLYRDAFPERVRPKVTTDIQSLSAYGFPQSLLQSWAGAIPSLNQLQVDAINNFNLLEGDHVVVSAPTSSGKTMIGELATLKGAMERERALFLLPLKALVNDKHKHFTETYGPFGVQTIEATGETDDIAPLLRGQYDICLMTYEKFAAVVLAHPHVLEQVGTVVVDEVQMIADKSRGANLEFILTLLRMRRRQGVEPQLIALSAVIGDTNGLERWLSARLLRRNDRPVPLDEGVLLGDGRFRFIDGVSGEEKTTEPIIQRRFVKNSSQNWVIPLVQKLVTEGKQAIVFRETKPEARACARYLARELGLPPALAALDALPTGDPTKASKDLRETLRGGVAFHIADLDREERRVIEEQFRLKETKLRVIAATTTLAMGVNTPAEAVVIVGLDHPGPNRTKQAYSVAEYKNLVGRAGRLGYSERGTSYLLALDPRQEHYTWNRYVTGAPENLESRFLDKNTDLRSLIVRVLVAVQRVYRQGIDAEDIVQFLEASFGAFQQMQQSEHWQWDRSLFSQSLQDLESHGLVECDNNRHYSLTELGRLAGEGGVEVVSIIRLVDCLRPLDPANINDPTLITAAQTPVELDEVYFPLNRSSTIKEPTDWVSRLQRQHVPGNVLNTLHSWVTDQHQATLRAKKAVACLVYVTDYPIVEIESDLTRHGGFPGGAAGAIRAVASRTCDVLPTVGKIAEILHPGLELGERIKRLLTRLDIGLPAAAVDLATQAGTRLTRGDYLQLLKGGLCEIDAIEASSDDLILACLGKDQEKLAIVRKATEAHRRKEREKIAVPPILDPYEEG
jgi:helicase